MRPLCNWEHCLKTYGPGLVNSFVLHTDFFNPPGKLGFDGEPEGPVVGNHSMVLIGVRRERTRTAKRWFLLQNWWSHSQFAEVSEEYMMACYAEVMFVKTPQHAILHALPSHDHIIAETEDIDTSEQQVFQFLTPTLDGRCKQVRPCPTSSSLWVDLSGEFQS